MTEQWREYGDGGHYLVSSEGRVFSKKTSRLLKLKKHPHHGHTFVCVLGKSPKVHRMVMEAFHGKSELQVNHKNGIRTDNRLENLEYCTGSENMLHSYRVLGRRSTLLGKFSSLNHNSKPVEAIYPCGRIEWFACQHDAVRNGSASNQRLVSECCRGKRKTHMGKRWRFA